MARTCRLFPVPLGKRLTAAASSQVHLPLDKTLWSVTQFSLWPILWGPSGEIDSIGPIYIGLVRLCLISIILLALLFSIIQCLLGPKKVKVMAKIEILTLKVLGQWWNFFSLKSGTSAMQTFRCSRLMPKHSEFELQPAQMQPSTWYATILNNSQCTPWRKELRSQSNLGPRSSCSLKFRLN